MNGISQRGLVSKEGPGSVAVGDVSELPDGNAVGQFHQGRFVLSPEGGDIVGIIQDPAAEIVRVVLGTARDELGGDSAGMVPVLTDHLTPVGIDGHERIVEFSVTYQVHEVQLHVMRHVDPAFDHVTVIQFGFCSHPDYIRNVLGPEVVSGLPRAALQPQLVTRKRVLLSYRVHGGIPGGHEDDFRILVLVKNETAAVVRLPETDIHLSAAIIGLLSTGKVQPGVHDPLVVFDQALVFDRGGIRIPGIPEFQPHPVPFRSGRGLPGLQDVRRSHVGQIRVNLLLFGVKPLDIGLQRALQHVVLFPGAHGQRFELREHGPDHFRSDAFHLLRHLPQPFRAPFV